MKSRDFVLFYLNGKRIEVRGSDSFLMLADFLRTKLHLIGTKIVCAEGDCGACSVLRHFPKEGEKEKPYYLPINSCITTVAQMDGSSLVTIEALAQREVLSPAQDSMMKCHASQCGFCTPGFVVALTGMLEKECVKKTKSISPQKAKNALTGNLCRCTGYQPIIDAATRMNPLSHSLLKDRYFSQAQKADLFRMRKIPVAIEIPDLSFSAPVSSKEVSKLLKKKNSRIFSGSTDLGVGINKGKPFPESVISLHLLKELYAIQKKGDRIWVGARATLEELRVFTEKPVQEFSRFLGLFASPQIKHTGTLIGNLANASPIGDTLPFLLVAGTRVFVQGNKKRVIPIEKFWKGYRKTALQKGEYILGVDFEIPSKEESLSLRKVSQRKDLDISAISAAFRMKRDLKTGKIKVLKIALGGVGPTPMRLLKTEKLLQGQVLSQAKIDQVNASLQREIAPQADLRGSEGFRRVLAERLMGAFFQDQERP